MKVICRTNLDLDREIWPEELPALPRVGDTIESARLGDDGIFRLRLQVIAVNFAYRDVSWGMSPKEWIPEIELHMGNLYPGMSIADFNNWCGR